MRIDFVLGTADRVGTLTVLWPAGTAERFEGLSIALESLIRQGEGKRVTAALDVE